MNDYMDINDSKNSEWRVPVNETEYPAQIEEYWARLAKGESQESIVGILESK